VTDLCFIFLFGVPVDFLELTCSLALCDRSASFDDRRDRRGRDSSVTSVTGDLRFAMGPAIATPNSNNQTRSPNEIL
jgi:hypothetical protein